MAINQNQIVNIEQARSNLWRPVLVDGRVYEIDSIWTDTKITLILETRGRMYARNVDITKAKVFVIA